MRLKPIKGYENEYAVSDDGKIFRKWKHSYYELKQFVNKDGYFQVCLCKGNVKKTVRVHRLVAEAFIPNPKKLPCVNHMDENKQNNHVENLEWCSVRYNNTYNNLHFKRAKKRWQPIIAFKEGNAIKFDSVREASHVLGINHGNISSCLSGKRNRAGGYAFFYDAERMCAQWGKN